jgi:hypothetical protein
MSLYCVWTYALIISFTNNKNELNLKLLFLGETSETQLEHEKSISGPL